MANEFSDSAYETQSATPAPVNEFSDAAYEGQKKQALRASMVPAVRVNPDIFGEATRAGRAAGIPAPAITPETLPAVKERVKLNDFDTLLDTSPKVAAQLSANPDLAKLGHDDVPNMQSIGAGIDKLINPIPDFLGRTLYRGFFQMQNKTASAVAAALETLSPTGGAQTEWLQRNVIQPLAQRGKELATPPDAGFGEKAVEAVGSAIGMLTQVVATPVPIKAAAPVLEGVGAAARAAFAGKTIGGAVVHGAQAMTMPAVSQAYETGKKVFENTGDAGAAARAAQMAYVTTVLGGVVPLSAAGGIVKRLATGGLSGAVTGEVSRQAQNIANPGTMQQDFGWEQLALSGITGAILAIGGPKGENPAPYEAIRKTYSDALAVDKANVSADTVERLLADSGVSKVNERDKPSFAQFADTHAGGTPVEDVHIDAEKFMQTAGDQLPALLESMPRTKARMDDALATKSDLAIPIGELLANIPGTGLEKALVDHIRVRPNEPTRAEAKDSSLIEQSKAATEKILSEGDFTENWRQSTEVVHKAIFDQLETAGRFPSSVNAAKATYAAALYATQAVREGKTPEQFYAEHPLDITSETLADTSTLKQEGPQVNIGLKVGDTGSITPEEAVAALREVGVEVTRQDVRDSNSEPTLIAELSRPLTSAEADAVSAKLQQEAIVQVANGVGTMHGPSAEKWGPFNPDYFLTLSGQPAGTLMQRGVKNITPAVRQLFKNLTVEEQNLLTDKTAEKAVQILKNAMPSSNESAAIAVAGAAKRGWYAESARAISEIFGPDAPHFTRLLAALSPQTGVESNLRNALNTWHNWVKAGRPQSKEAIVDVLERSVEGATEGGQKGGVLPAWVNNAVRALSYDDVRDIPLSGPKVNSFHENLSGNVNEVTLDTWMANYALVKQALFARRVLPALKRGVKGTGYIAMNAHIRDTAKVLSKLTGETWTPSEVQETIWSWAKALYEHASNTQQTAVSALKAGTLTRELVNSTPDFATLFHDPEFAGILERAGYGEELKRLASARGNNERQPGEESGTESQASPFAADTQQRYELAAARRLDKLRAQRAAEEQLKQGEDQGSFTPQGNRLALLAHANLSTFFHEMGHFYLELLHGMSSKADAAPGVVSDFNAILKWFGVTPEQWAGMSFEQRRQYHEQFARGNEQYLLEGKAPSTALQPLFQRFRSWIINAYRGLTGGLGVTLTPEVRGVFDRMLATNDEIVAAEKARNYQPMFGEKPEGMSDVDWLAYHQMNHDATQQATEELQTRSVKDMAWTSAAKTKALKEIHKTASTIRNGIRAEVASEVNAEPIYQAIRFLRKGETIDANGDLVKAAKGFKLNTSDLAELYPETSLARPDLTRLRGMTSPDGLHPDQVADIFGFQSGDQLVRTLIDTEPATEKIDGLTDQRMLQEHGDLADPASVDRAANEAIHNEVRAKFVATEARMLDKAIGQRSLNTRAAKEAADTIVARKRIRDVRPALFEAAEARAARNAERAFGKDDLPVAAGEKRTQLVNGFAAKAAYEAQNDVTKGVAYLNRVQAAAAQKGMRGGYLKQLNALLERFDLRKSVSLRAIDEAKPALADWIKSEADRLSAVEPDVAPFVLDESIRAHYKDLTVEQFRGLVDSVKALEFMARREQSQYIAIRKQNFQQERQAMLDTIRQNHPDAFNAEGVPNEQAPDFVPSIGRGLAKMKGRFLGEFLSIENLARILEVGKIGAVHESLFKRLSDASNWKEQRMTGIFRKIEPLLKQYSLPERLAFSHKDITGEIETSKRLTRENAVMVALLNGNAEGRARLANYGWDEAKINSIINLLDARDMKLVDSIWKLFDEDLWPELRALNERTRGKAPPKVEPLPYTTRHGEARGGYMRLKYDTNLDERHARLDETAGIKELMGGTFGMSAKTNQGTSTERVQNVTARPRLDLGVFGETVNETVHDLAFREAVADTMRVLNDPGVTNAVKNVLGTEGYRAFGQRVRDVAAAPRDPSGFVENFATIARRNTVVGMLSGVKTALLNMTNIASSFVGSGKDVAPGRLALEFTKMINPVQMVARTRFAMENSSYMRGRFETYDRSLRDGIKKLTVNGRIMPDTAHMLFIMSYLDRAVAVPTWNAAFAKGMEIHNNDFSQAVEHADSYVRHTQGSGREVDMARIMAGQGPGGEIKKLVTMFTSYFNGQLGLLTTAGAVAKHEVKANPVLAATKFTAKFLAAYAIPAALYEILYNGVEGNDKESDDQVRRWTRVFSTYGAGMVPLIGPMLNYYFNPQFSYRLSPVESAVESIVKAGVQTKDFLAQDDEAKAKDIIMGYSYLMGLPGRLISDVYNGTKAWAEGDAGPESILLGPPKE